MIWIFMWVNDFLNPFSHHSLVSLTNISHCLLAFLDANGILCLFLIKSVHRVRGAESVRLKVPVVFFLQTTQFPCDPELSH